RRRRDSGQQRSDEGILWQLKQRSRRIHLGKARPERHSIERDRGAGETWQDQRLPGECQQTLKAGVKRVGARSCRRWVREEIRTTDGVQEERIASEERLLVKQVAGAFRRVHGRAQGSQPRTADRDGVVVADRGMGERDSLLLWQVEGGAGLFGQRARAR